MSRRFDFSWDMLPHDGATTPLGVPIPFDRSENDELLEAWCRERHVCIELRIYLDQSVRLIKRILSEGVVTAEDRRRAKHLILAIRAAKGE